MNAPRIVVDSNVFISAALAIYNKHLDSPSAAVFFKVVQKDVVGVASPQMLYELAGKLSNPRFGLTSAFVIDFVRLLADAVEMVSIRGLDMGCRDEKDNMFIETAYNGRVDVLVTRDRDLQDALTRYDLTKRKCQVLNVSDFLTALRQIASRKEASRKRHQLRNSWNRPHNDGEPLTALPSSNAQAPRAAGAAAGRQRAAATRLRPDRERFAGIERRIPVA